MKKLISGISALITAAMLFAPMTAFADTTVSPTGGDPFDVTPNPGTAGTTVEFSIDPAYTVTIPATVTLEKGEGDIYSNSGTITAEGVKLAEGKEIVVTLASASKFNMQTSTTAEYKLPYTAEGAFGKLTDKETAVSLRGLRPPPRCRIRRLLSQRTRHQNMQAHTPTRLCSR